MRNLLIAVAIATASGAASAAPTFDRRPPAQADDGSIAAATEAMAGYSRWLARVQEIEAPIQQHFARLSAEWATLNWGRPERAVATVRANLREMLTAVDRASAEVEALETPAFAELDLPEDIRPVAIRRDMIRLNGEFRSVIDAFEPVLRAIGRRDTNAAVGATAGLMSSVRVLLDSQMLFIRAGQAGTDREASSWHVIDVQLHLVRAMIRLLRAYPANGVSGVDRTLPRDLDTIAADIDATATSGESKLAGEVASLEADARQVEAEGDGERARFARNTAQVLRIEGRVLGVGRRLADLLRETATRLERQPFSAPDLAAAVRPFQPMRLEMDAIVAESLTVFAPTN